MSETWEQQTLQKLLQQGIKEQTSKRRWSIFFKLVMLGYVIVLTIGIGLSLPRLTSTINRESFTAVVDIEGEIANKKDANAEEIISAINMAFSHPMSKAVILRINSPGGSPVQSHMIYKEILRLRAMYTNKPCYTAIEDVGASAAYLIALATEKIYANEFSVVGSIGVKAGGFGFAGALEKHGIERRLYTSGNDKGMLDAFLPRNLDQEKILLDQIKLVHQDFIKIVKKSRGKMLLGSDAEFYSGRVWIGIEAKINGIIDDFADTASIAREIVKVPNTVVFTNSLPMLNKFNKWFNKVTNSFALHFTQAKFLFI